MLQVGERAFGRASGMADFDIGFVIFPGITQLDFTGPFEVLSRLSTPPSAAVPSRFPQSRTHVIAKTLQPVTSDRGLKILPSCTFDSSPSLNLICVPGGGGGVVDALADDETVEFIRHQGERAQFVTSVCTGVFLLGAAGLEGRRAVTQPTSTFCSVALATKSHRARRECLHFGRLRIDFVQHVPNLPSEVAEVIQLAIEYDPAPPFDAGHPDKASEATTAFNVQRNEKAHAGIREKLEKLAISSEQM